VPALTCDWLPTCGESRARCRDCCRPTSGSDRSPDRCGPHFTELDRIRRLLGSASTPLPPETSRLSVVVSGGTGQAEVVVGPPAVQSVRLGAELLSRHPVLWLPGHTDFTAKRLTRTRERLSVPMNRRSR
jgi:hypothetical protein